jgi:hypothetical protein
MIRRLAGALTLAAVVAASAASHHHAILAGESDTRSEEIVTTHNPYSTASHLHAILRILPVDPCWACHWSRVPGMPGIAAVVLPDFIGWKLNALPPRSAVSVARFTRGSRGPPDLS